MVDIFVREDLRCLLNQKKVIFLGDSNVRSYYFDMLCLLHQSRIIDQRTLKLKMEKSMFGDSMLVSGERNNGRDYREERAFETKEHYFAFYFITRVFNEYTETVIKNVAAGKPDVIIINSCFWDMSRWGPKGVEEFKENLLKLLRLMNSVLDKNCLVIWATAPPLAARPYGGFLLLQLDFLKYSLRFHVLEANTYAKKAVVQHGYDILDLHYHLRMQVHMRCPDGVHWTPRAVRYITNLILTHISLAWGFPLPHRRNSIIVDKVQVTNDENGKHEPTKAEFNTTLRKPIQSIGNTMNANRSRTNNFPGRTLLQTPIRKPKSKKNKNRYQQHSPYRGYLNQQRIAQAHRNIRRWEPESRPPCQPQTLLPYQPEMLQPYQPEMLQPCQPQALPPYEPRVLLPCPPQALPPYQSQVLSPCQPQPLPPYQPQVLSSCQPQMLSPCQVQSPFNYDFYPNDLNPYAPPTYLTPVNSQYWEIPPQNCYF